MDKAMTIEDLMREKGQLVKKGTLGEDSDIEFWEDGTTTTRMKLASEKEWAKRDDDDWV
jgi:protein import protein ZIM17